MLEGNKGAYDEIHRSARVIMERGNCTPEQVERWREDLGDKAVEKLLKEYPQG